MESAAVKRGAPPSPPAQRGFTLLEMLVVFVLVGILTGLLVQALNYVLRIRATALEVSNAQRIELLQEAWFRKLVGGIAAVEPDRPGYFGGTAGEIRGLSLTGLGTEPGVPVVFRLSLTNDGNALALRYAAGEGEGDGLPLSDWAGAEGSFAYRDDEGTWHDRWPLDEDEAAAPLPTAIKLRVGGAVQKSWIVFLPGRRIPKPDLRNVL